MASAVVATSRELKTPTGNYKVLLEAFKPPVYNAPYPDALNPQFKNGVYSKYFKEKAKEWMQELKVDTQSNPKLFKMLYDMDVSGLSARVYPAAGEWELEFASKFFFMLWVWDDNMDLTELGSSPGSALRDLMDVQMLTMWTFPDDPLLLARMEPFLSHFKGQELEEKRRNIESMLAEAKTKPGSVYPKVVSDICNVFHDLWKTLVARASPDVCLRVAHFTQLWHLGYLQETENRERNSLPTSIDNYIQIRRGSSAVLTTITFLDLIYGLETPDSWFYSPEMLRVMDALNDIVAWHNDIWSFKREVLVEKPEVFNMVLLVSVYKNVSYSKAAEITTQMLYDRIADLEKAQSDLESITPPELRRSFDMYTLTTRSWVSGTHYWHAQNFRYE